MNTEEVILYRGIIITCPLCGRSHGLTVKETTLNSFDVEYDKIMLICPTCGLEFEGTSIAIWKRSKALASLNEAARNFNDTLKKLSPTSSPIYTVYLLDEINHTRTKCFRIASDIESISEILDCFSKTCRQGEKYIAFQEAD